MIEPQDLTFLVLCGGAATRMGGVDKPLQRWRDSTLLDHVLASVDTEVPRLISANRNLAAYAKRGPVITDEQASVRCASPLSGILAALEHIDTNWLLVAPGDTPELQPGWHTALLDNATESKPAVIFDGQQQQHLHSVIPRGARHSLAKFLAAGHMQVWKWLAEAEALAVPVGDAAAADMFRNVNTLSDLNLD